MKELQAELDELRRHPPIQPRCDTCVRVRELELLIEAQR